jgi:hypothetical protein
LRRFVVKRHKVVTAVLLGTSAALVALVAVLWTLSFQGPPRFTPRDAGAPGDRLAAAAGEPVVEHPADAEKRAAELARREAELARMREAALLAEEARRAAELSDAVDLVDRVVSDLEWGNIAYDPPKKIEFGDSAEIQLLLSPSHTVSELQLQLDRSREPQGAILRISNRMEAQLSGQGFSISALTPDVQAVSGLQATRWAWEVEPRDYGTQRLHLALSAHIEVAGHDTPLVVRTFDRFVEVEITFGQRVSGFFQENWKWLWAAILVPMATFLWRRTRRPAGSQAP